MLFIKLFRSKGSTKKHICVALCIFFIVLCVFILVCGFIDSTIWKKIYSMPDSGNVPVIIVYVFASALLINCVFLLISLKQDASREILICVLIKLALWQVHLILTFIAFILHTISNKDFRAIYAFSASLPLLCIQALWLYFISVGWYYWRELTNQLDVPSYIQTLILKRKRRKAIREDQRERLGNLPTKFLDALIPQSRGIASANAL